MNWTAEWPTEPGLYWFYGWLWLNKNWETEGRKPEFDLIKVHKNSRGDVICITNGNFMFKEERHMGLWKLVDLPELPDLDQHLATLGKKKQ